jgi:ammonium transporter, Amt family
MTRHIRSFGGGRAALRIGAGVLVLLGTAAAAHAEEAAIDSGDTAWILTSSALVLMMTAPGLALFYGGLVRAKNVLNLLMQSFILMALISVQWVLWGYSVSFSEGTWFAGGLGFLGLRGVGATPSPLAPTIPHQAFMAFQMMFAIITPALMTGAFAERMKFSAFLVFSLLWASIVYNPLAHMVWGGGWLGLGDGNLGALDFAGGTVVHISSGISALVCVFVIGKRLGYGSDPMPPHNMPFVLTGAALLWFGWFGFNAGSALAANGLAAAAFVTTNTAAAAAALSWMFAEWLGKGKPTVLGAASGAVAGLVAITPAAGFVMPMAALAIGLIAGVLCYGACNLKPRLGLYDDALDVVGVHGVGGTWGAIATGLWASTEVNSVVTTQGLLVSGEMGLLGAQVTAVLVTYVLAIVGTLVCLGIAGAVTGGLRVDDDQEFAGLDLSQHSESAYVFGSTGGYGASTHEAFAPRPVAHRAPASITAE